MEGRCYSLLTKYLYLTLHDFLTPAFYHLYISIYILYVKSNKSRDL
jgi:hypothetical protein